MQQIGHLAGNMDVAEIVLATFGLFFLGLVVYIQRESNREGFPLVGENGERLSGTSLFGVPKPKRYILPNGQEVWLPRAEPQEILPTGVVHAFQGGPLDPVGNKLLSGVGPAAYCQRADVPDDCYYDGSARIVPLRVDAAYSVAEEGPDPRGYKVAGVDNVVVGKVVDIWVDRIESVARYFEVALTTEFSGRHVLLPVPMSDVQDGLVKVYLIQGRQFADAPGTKSMDEVTALEEDKIAAYFGSGLLFATSQRSEPLI